MFFCFEYYGKNLYQVSFCKKTNKQTKNTDKKKKKKGTALDISDKAFAHEEFGTTRFCI